MARANLLEEFQVSLFVPAGLSARQTSAMRRTLDTRKFRDGVARAVRQHLRRYPSLRSIRVAVGR